MLMVYSTLMIYYQKNLCINQYFKAEYLQYYIILAANKTLHKCILWKYHCLWEKFLCIPQNSITSLKNNDLKIIGGFIRKHEKQESGKAGRKEWRETGKYISQKVNTGMQEAASQDVSENGFQINLHQYSTQKNQYILKIDIF